MRKTGRVYKRMIITYILVLCIPVFLSAVLYQYTYNTVREQSKKNNNNLLETVKNSCDREISYYKSVLQQLKTDEDVDLLVNSVTLSQGERVYLAREVQMKMTAMIVSMLDYAEYCQDMFIYFSDQDDVVSAKTKANFEYYSTVTMEIDQQESVALREQLDRLENRKMVMVNSKHMEYVLLVEPVRTQTGKPLNIVFGIWVDARVFEQQVKSTDWNYGTEWAFVSGDAEIVYVTDGIDRNDLNVEELYGIDDREVNIGGDEYLVHTIESGAYDGKYILFSSASLISQTANKIRNVHLLCMFISVLLGYVVTRVSVRKNYSSLERVINILPERGDGKAGQDEFQYLENRVSDLLERYDDIHENMKENKRAAQELAFEKLLLPQGTKEREEIPYTKELYAKFKKGVNMVLVFCIRDNLSTEGGKNAPVLDNSLKRFVVANVLAEGVGEKYTQETKEYDDRVVMIVNLPEGKKEGDENLQSLCDKYCGFVEDNFRFRINTFAGTAYEGVKGIHYSYLEACQAENFGMDSDENFVCYNDIDDYTVRMYQYSFETEEAVINAVRSENVHLANSLIDNVLEKNFNNKDKTLWQCMLYDIYTTLIKVAEERNISLNKMPIINQAFTKSTLQEQKEWFHRIVERICERKEEEETENKQDLYQGILNYIENNYTDPDLNISQIAMEFHMTPTYLSALFKRQIGKSILDVIRQMRIEYARELLAQGMSVSEVSAAAGFRESSTFIRAFKNQVGITPGQMKKLI